MNCKEFIDFMTAYVEGDLPAEQRRIFESHIDDCPPCKQYLDTYRTTIKLEKACCCKDTQCCEVPRGLIDAILAARAAEESRSGEGL